MKPQHDSPIEAAARTHSALALAHPHDDPHTFAAHTMEQHVVLRPKAAHRDHGTVGKDAHYRRHDHLYHVVAFHEGSSTLHLKNMDTGHLLRLPIIHVESYRPHPSHHDHPHSELGDGTLVLKAQLFFDGTAVRAEPIL